MGTPLCPAWVLRRLLLEGIGDPREEEGRRRGPSASVPRWCKRCGQPTYVGYAWPDPEVVVDVTPTTPDEEYIARWLGRGTFHRNVHRALERRRNRYRFASADEEVVLLEHRCEGPFPQPNDRWKPIGYPEGVIPF